MFLANAAAAGLRNNNELINLAWVPNEFGFLSEKKSVNEYLKIFAGLILRGQDFDIRDEMGRTPLMHAGLSGYNNLQIALLKIGARTDLTDNDARTAADLATMTARDGVTPNLYYIEKFLSNHGYYIADAIFDAFNQRDFRQLQKLFDRGAYVDTFDLMVGKSLLTYAVEKNDLEMAEFLLKNGADPNFVMRGASAGRVYPVMEAANAGHVEAVALLLKYHADINATGIYPYETNAVRQAMWNASHESNLLETQIIMLDWLLDHGADPDFHRTPFAQGKPVSLKEFEAELFPTWKFRSTQELAKRKAAVAEVLLRHGF